MIIKIYISNKYLLLSRRKKIKKVENKLIINKKLKIVDKNIKKEIINIKDIKENTILSEMYKKIQNKFNYTKKIKPKENKKNKKNNKLSIFQLKMKVKHPELVEEIDTTAKYPLFNMKLKSIEDSVPIPRNWCSKKRYLIGKKGFIKPPLPLPDFLKKIGFIELPTDIKYIKRNLINVDEHKKSIDKIINDEKISGKDKILVVNKLKEKFKIDQLREEKLLKEIVIPNNILKETLDKNNFLENITDIGDIYYEGKEFTFINKNHCVGKLSEPLIIALGMKSVDSPPPYLFNMQKYGPPPSYPKLKIKGVNIGIPIDAEWGFGVEGWGIPPVDENNVPLYGNVFKNTKKSNKD